MEKVKLGDVCERGSSNIAQKDIINKDGLYPIYGASGIIKYVDFYTQENEYIAIVKDGAGIGRTMILPAKSSIIGTMQYIFPKKNIYVRYLYYAIKSMNLAKYYSGVTIPHIYFKDYQKEQLYLPELDMQKSIAQKLDEIQEIIDIREKQLEQLDELIKSQFVEMFGDPFLNEKSWKTNTIGECCTLKSGTSLPAEVENEGGDVLYIKVGDMNLIGNEKNITTSSHRVTEKTAGKGIFELGTILFPKRGGAIGTNKKRLTVSKVCADLNVMGVTPTSKLLSEYLYTYFLFIDLGSLNNGSSVPQINNKDIEPLIIPLPPIECQNQFADFVKVIDKQKFEIQKSLEEMQLLQESLMNKYFGEM